MDKKQKERERYKRDREKILARQRERNLLKREKTMKLLSMNPDDVLKEIGFL